MLCSCGLSQERVVDLDQRDRVPLIGGLCQNPFTKPDGTLGICRKPLGDHHSVPITFPPSTTAEIEALKQETIRLEIELER